MTTYLVTGGAGFIGSHLVKTLLANGDSVRVLDDLSTGKRKNLPADAEFIHGDATDAAAVRSAMGGVQGCFHLAAIASVQRGTEDWLGTHRVNLGGTIAVLDAARPATAKPAIPVVFASSAAVYGACQNLPLVESERLLPLSAYGADKLGSEQHGFVAANMFGVPVTALRFFNVYGPRQDPASPYSGVISIFCRRISQGEPIEIYGDGLQTRDFIYVSDVVRALMAAMKKPGAGFRTLNVCTGRETTLLHLAAKLMDFVGKKTEIRHGPVRPGDIRASLGAPHALRSELAIEATTSVEQGLAQTLRWIGD